MVALNELKAAEELFLLWPRQLQRKASLCQSLSIALHRIRILGKKIFVLIDILDMNKELNIF